MKFANGLIKKIPGKVLTKINQKVGFRFITKFGTKGIVNMGKLIPGVGAVIGGSLDLVETKAIGARAYKWFFEGDFETENSPENDCMIVDGEEQLDSRIKRRSLHITLFVIWRLCVFKCHKLFTV